MVSDRRQRSSIITPTAAAHFVPPPKTPVEQPQRRASTLAVPSRRRSSVGGVDGVSDFLAAPGPPHASLWEALRVQFALEKQRKRAARDHFGQGLALPVGAPSGSAASDEGAVVVEEEEALDVNPIAAHAHALWSGMLMNVKVFIELPEDQKDNIDPQKVAEEREGAL